MPYLSKIQYCLPRADKAFEKQFMQFLSPLGTVTPKGIDLTLSRSDYLPSTSFIFKDTRSAFTQFVFDGGRTTTVEIANTTGANKQSPYHYSHIALGVFIERMQRFPLLGLDHTGFNLPYFEGVHPKIVELRQELKAKCLYHTFPKHLEDAPWDFIIPGTREEIARVQETDYQLVRKPKVEIVSFENSSTPLIQIDIQVQGKYEEMVDAFPEALHVPEIRNMWVYLQNEYGIDICFVLNESSGKDWSYQFQNDRLS